MGQMGIEDRWDSDSGEPNGGMNFHPRKGGRKSPPRMTGFTEEQLIEMFGAPWYLAYARKWGRAKGAGKQL